MNKFSLLTSLLFALGIAFSSSLFAQEESLLSKKGKIILPDKGDFALGISANPFFDYVGNLLSNAGTNSLRTRLLESNMLFAKYYLQDRLALRLKLRVNGGTNTLSNTLVDNTNPASTTEDKLVRKSSQLEFTPGIEFRRGSSRAQIGFGGEIVFMRDKLDDTYTYGNSFSPSVSNPTTTVDFDSKIVSNVNSRIIKQSSGNATSFGLRAFASIEYFFAPKISIGAELGLGFLRSNSGDSQTESQFWDFTNSVVRNNTTEDFGDKTSQINTDILNGQIFLLFHF